MSFTNEVCAELLSVPQKKTCCRKAFLLGLLFSAHAEEETLVSYFYQEEVARAAEELLDKLVSSDVRLRDIYIMMINDAGDTKIVKKEK